MIKSIIDYVSCFPLYSIASPFINAFIVGYTLMSSSIDIFFYYSMFTVPIFTFAVSLKCSAKSSILGAI